MNSNEIAIKQLPKNRTALGEIKEAVLSGSEESDPTWRDKVLALVQEKNIVLATLEIKELLGITPRGQGCSHRNWVLTRSGKVGKNKGWIVTQKKNSH